MVVFLSRSGVTQSPQSNCDGAPAFHSSSQTTEKQTTPLEMTNHVQETPLLGLRMKQTQPERTVSQEAALDTLGVMIAQDAGAYKTRDYLGRRRKRSVECSETGLPSDESVDPACREKMCEWGYRCCDHFDIQREACAFAFSFLDRFMDYYDCNRTAFKLAAMTCIYISTKMLHVKQISVATLADLSRGEFDAEHLAEMEKIVLQTLDYRLNPPTIQAFLSRLRPLLPSMSESTEDAVYQRAVFYSELCVYDYYFVVESRYDVAVACLLNAFVDVCDNEAAKRFREVFLADLSSSICVEVSTTSVQKAQRRLFYLYNCSAQSSFEDYTYAESSERTAESCRGKEESDFASSPVGVDMKPAVRLRM